MNTQQFRNFEIFLEASGAEILAPTNPYEAVRFRANGVIGIVYQNKYGKLTYCTEEAKKAFKRFIEGKGYSANDPKRRVRKNQVLNTLLQRDGSDCFYCGKEIPEGLESVEHLLSINKGGSNHIANLVLSHKECNALAGHMDIVNKVNLRETMRRKS